MFCLIPEVEKELPTPCARAGDILEFIGVNGLLRVGLTEEQLRKAIRVTSQIEP